MQDNPQHPQTSANTERRLFKEIEGGKKNHLPIARPKLQQLQCWFQLTNGGLPPKRFPVFVLLLANQNALNEKNKPFDLMQIGGCQPPKSFLHFEFFIFQKPWVNFLK